MHIFSKLQQTDERRMWLQGRGLLTAGLIVHFSHVMINGLSAELMTLEIFKNNQADIRQELNCKKVNLLKTDSEPNEPRSDHV